MYGGRQFFEVGLACFVGDSIILASGLLFWHGAGLGSRCPPGGRLQEMALMA